METLESMLISICLPSLAVKAQQRLTSYYPGFGRQVRAPQELPEAWRTYHMVFSFHSKESDSYTGVMICPTFSISGWKGMALRHL